MMYEYTEVFLVLSYQFFFWSVIRETKAYTLLNVNDFLSTGSPLLYPERKYFLIQSAIKIHNKNINIDKPEQNC